MAKPAPHEATLAKPKANAPWSECNVANYDTNGTPSDTNGTKLAVNLICWQVKAAFHDTNGASHDTNVASHDTNAAPHDTNAAPHDTNAAPHDTNGAKSLLDQVLDDTTAASSNPNVALPWWKSGRAHPREQRRQSGYHPLVSFTQ